MFVQTSPSTLVSVASACGRFQQENHLTVKQQRNSSAEYSHHKNNARSTTTTTTTTTTTSTVRLIKMSTKTLFVILLFVAILFGTPQLTSISCEPLPATFEPHPQSILTPDVSSHQVNSHSESSSPTQTSQVNSKKKNKKKSSRTSPESPSTTLHAASVHDSIDGSGEVPGQFPVEDGYSSLGSSNIATSVSGVSESSQSISSFTTLVSSSTSTATTTNSTPSQRFLQLVFQRAHSLCASTDEDAASVLDTVCRQSSSNYSGDGARRINPDAIMTSDKSPDGKRLTSKNQSVKPLITNTDNTDPMEIPTVPPKKEDMLSFSEWRRKVGEQMDSVHKLQQQPEVPPPQTSVLPEKLPQHVKLVINRARNFASHECGAKIVDSNPESDFGNRALNDQKDDYMLNPCQASNWFVVELCETIQPQYLEIANFELYSSIPKEFSVLASEHYPPRTEWSNLGSNFTAQDVRTLQGFKLLNNGFVKYLKISLKSYYGDKHFCPISVVRVFGTSLFDEVDRIDKKIPHSQPEFAATEEAESSTAEESLNVHGKENDIFGHAKKAVMNIFVKALNFNLFNKIIENVSSNKNQNSNFNIRKQSEVVAHYGPFEKYLDECEPYFRDGPPDNRSSLNIPSKCRFLRFTYHSDLFDQLYTQYFIRNYVDPDLFLQCGKNETYSDLNATGLSRIISESVAHIRSQLNNTAQAVPLPAGSVVNNGSVEPNINLSVQNYGTLTNVVTNIESSQIQPTIMQTVINTLPLPVAPTVVSVTSNFHSSHQPVIKDVETVGRHYNDPPAEVVKDYNKDLLSSTGGQSKEAVIVRLSNRIKNLESNISLMSAYLEDLSVRYRTQMEEMQMMFNRTIDHLNNTAIRAAEKDAKQQENILALELEILKIRDDKNSVLGNVELMNKYYMMIHLCLMLFEFFIVFIIGIFFFISFKRFSNQMGTLANQQWQLTQQSIDRSSADTSKVFDSTKLQTEKENDIYLLATETLIANDSQSDNSCDSLLSNKENQPVDIDNENVLSVKNQDKSTMSAATTFKNIDAPLSSPTSCISTSNVLKVRN